MSINKFDETKNSNDYFGPVEAVDDNNKRAVKTAPCVCLHQMVMVSQ